jgi:SAM-dependent methyltransferase
MAAFVPASEDVPSYLLPMMNDVDRNAAYERAVKETIERFQAEQKRAPRVLDVGAGAGLLSLMCLEYGAAHVTLLEANKTLSTLAQEQLRLSKHAASRWTIASCMSTDLTLKAGQAPFDMIVSELIGTMVHSESMSIYLWDLVKRGIVQSFAPPKVAPVPQDATSMDTDSSSSSSAASSPVSPASSTPSLSPTPLLRYMVPQSGAMTARIVRSEHGVGLKTGLQFASMKTIYEAVYDTRRVSSRCDWNSDESMRFCLASGPWEAISPALPVLRERYDVAADPIDYKPSVRFVMEGPVPSDAVVVLEWTVQLSPSHQLHHTLDHVAAMHPQVRLARWINWGFTFAPLHHFVDDASLASGVCEMMVTWHAADIEFVSKKCDPVAAKAAPAEAEWMIVKKDRLNKVLAATKQMVQRGETSVD